MYRDIKRYLFSVFKLLDLKHTRFLLRVRLNIDIVDIIIELDLIPNLTIIVNGLQYEFIVWM
jgi:hypothetical protein